jgi:hypothetical protein
MIINKETGIDLLNWFEDEVKIHHYDPVQTPPRAPYELYELKDELIRRLEKSDYYSF